MSDFELPSDKQLEQLREGGLTPYSSFLTSSFIALIVSTCVFFCFDHYIAIFNEFISFDDIAKKTNFIMKLLLLPPVAVLVSALLFILFQKKFYFKISFLYPFFRKRLKFDLFYRFSFYFFKNLFFLVFGVILVLFSSFYIFPHFFEILMKSGEDDLIIFLLSLKSFLTIFIVVELCLIFVWFVISKLLFLFSVVMNKNKVLSK